MTGTVVLLSVLSGHLHAGLQGPVLDGLEYVLIEGASSVALEGKAQQCERVRHSLNAQTDRSVPHVGLPGLLHRLLVLVDDLIEVASENLDNGVHCLMVETTVLQEHG